MLRLALSALGLTRASVSSYNNHWGVPLSLAQFPRGCRFGVFEIGMNHFGEIRSLVGFVRPHIAIITTIAPAHLEYFGSVEASKMLLRASAPEQSSPDLLLRPAEFTPDANPKQLLHAADTASPSPPIA